MMMRRSILEQLTRETGSQVVFSRGFFIQSPWFRFRFFGTSKDVIRVTANESDVMVNSCDPATEHALIQTTEIGQDDSLLNSLSYIMRTTLLQLPEVRSVYFNSDEAQMTVDVWTILHDATDEHRRAVYQKELEVIDAFPTLFFNFRTSGVSAEASPASSDYHHLTK